MIKRKENPSFTFWYHINQNSHFDGAKGCFKLTDIHEGLNEALQQRQEEILSQIKDWNNIERLNVQEIIKRLEELT